MPFQLEVSDRLGSWGCAGQTFRPGIYIVSEQIAEAARRNTLLDAQGRSLLIVTEVPEAHDAEYFDTHPQLSGEMTRKDLVEGTPDGAYVCPVEGCNRPYKTEPALKAHLTRTHPNYVPEQPSVMEPEAPPTPPVEDIEDESDASESPFTITDGEDIDGAENEDE